MAKLKDTFQAAFDACTGAQAMFFTDRDGVLVMSVGEELRGRQQIIANHQNSIEQVSRMGMGDHKSSVYFYKQSQVVICSMGPHLYLFIVGPEDGNTGLYFQMRDKLMPFAREIEKAIPAVTIDREAEAEKALAALNVAPPAEPAKPFPEVKEVKEEVEVKPASAPLKIKSKVVSEPEPSSSQWYGEEQREQKPTRSRNPYYDAEVDGPIPPWRYAEGTNKQSPFDKHIPKTRYPELEQQYDDSELN